MMKQRKFSYDLSPFFYRMAFEFADLAKTWKRKKRDELKMAILDLSVASIVLAAFCGESYINGFLLRKLTKGEWQCLERQPVRDKWRRGVEKVTKDKEATFKAGEEPFSSYSEIVDLRNEIAHYKHPQPLVTVDDTSSTSLLRAAQKDICEKFTPETARKACESVKSMIQKLHEFDGTSVPYWLSRWDSAVYSFWDSDEGRENRVQVVGVVDFSWSDIPWHILIGEGSVIDLLDSLKRQIDLCLFKGEKKAVLLKQIEDLQRNLASTAFAEDGSLSGVIRSVEPCQRP